MSNKKEIAFILDGLEDGLDIAEAIKVVFDDWDAREIFWDEDNNVFFSLEGDKETFYPFVLSSGLVVNLLAGEKFSQVEERLRAMNIPHLQNSPKTVSLFSNTLGSKMVLQKKGIKTPVFEKTTGQTEKEIFANFPQPAKIYDNLVEEDIEGEKVELLLFKNEEEVICLNSQADQEIVVEAKKIFEELNVEKFAVMDFISSPQRGLYLTNIFVDLDILLKDKAKNLKKIKKIL